MALLLPNLPQVRKLSFGIKDGAVRTAMQSIEAWAEEFVRRMAVLEEATGGVTLPIAESDVTNLPADLAAKAPASRTLSGTSPIRIDGGASGDLSANRTISVLDNSTTNRGTVAAAPNDTTKFYRGDATWAVPSGVLTVVGSTTLGAAASTITVSGLNGDADVNYEIEFNWLASGTSAHSVDLRPNGDTSTTLRPVARVLDGGTPASSTDGIITTNGAVSQAVSGRYNISAFVARDATITYYRRFASKSTLTWNNGAGCGNWMATVVYSSNTSNLTSITMGITTVQFAAGSQLIVRKWT